MRLTNNNPLQPFSYTSYLITPSVNADSRTAELTNIEDWACSNNLKLNRSQSVEIIITRQRRKRLSHVSLMPTLSDIARVQTIKILGVTISDHLSVNQHVTNVIASCAQTFYALRVLQAHGLNKDALEGVFKAVVIAKLTYASPAWWGFTTAHDRQKMESVIRATQRHVLTD